MVVFPSTVIQVACFFFTFSLSPWIDGNFGGGVSCGMVGYGMSWCFSVTLFLFLAFAFYRYNCPRLCFTCNVYVCHCIMSLRFGDERFSHSLEIYLARVGDFS